MSKRRDDGERGRSTVQMTAEQLTHLLTETQSPALDRGSSEQPTIELSPDDIIELSDVIELSENERRTSKMDSEAFRKLLRPGAARPGPSLVSVEPLDERKTRALPPLRARKRLGVAPLPSPSASAGNERRHIQREAMPRLDVGADRLKSPMPEAPNTARARPRSRKAD